MSENSKIEWTDHTFNPWIGCTKISPGCDHCYAKERMENRLHIVNWGAAQPRKLTSAANWRDPIKWNARHEQFFAKHGRRQRVFCASLADVFDNEVPDEWRRDLFSLIELTPNLNWLLLTKRIGNVFTSLMNSRSHDWLAGRNNVWLGITICNQAEADRDIPKLLETPARVRFLSMEPLLGPVDLTELNYGDNTDALRGEKIFLKANQRVQKCPHIDWVIVGGESGCNSRPLHPDWVRGLRDQCAAAAVPFLFKQWGEWAPYCTHEQMIATDYLLPTDHHYVGIAPDGAIGRYITSISGMHWVRKLGKKAAGRLLDGSIHEEFPEAIA